METEADASSSVLHSERDAEGFGSAHVFRALARPSRDSSAATRPGRQAVSASHDQVARKAALVGIAVVSDELG